MLKEERYDKILEILEEENYVSVHKLSKMLYVSLPTIRRDLTELQLRKQIIRSHGGAKKIQNEHVVAPLDFRKTINSTEKRKLCRGAASFVEDNDIVFIDASTTTMQIADFLTELIKKGIKTYCTGGEIFENSLAHFGSFAEEFIQKFNIDILIFSCHGVNEKGILTDPSLPETQIRKTAIAQSKKTVFLCDESKLTRSAPFNLVPIQEIDYIVTNSEKFQQLFLLNEGNNIIVV